MNCAITGATGFVGSLVKTKMIDAGHYVTFLHRPCHLDGNVDVLVHCSAYLPPSYNESSEAQKCLMDNFIATLQLIDQAQSTELKVLVYISSGHGRCSSWSIIFRKIASGMSVMNPQKQWPILALALAVALGGQVRALAMRTIPISRRANSPKQCRAGGAHGEHRARTAT